MEGTDQVFSRRQIDPDFRAQSAVDLSDEGGRDLDEVHSSLVGCGHESGRVSHNASAECYDPVLATQTVSRKSFVEVANGVEIFIALSLAHGDEKDVQAHFVEALAELLAIEAVDSSLSDDGDFPLGSPKLGEPAA